MSTMSVVRCCGLFAFTLFVSPAWAQADSGDMMKVNITMKMQMSGVGDIPAHTVTQNVCTSKDRDMRAMVQRQKNCAVSNYEQVGSVVSYHMVCGGSPPTMTGDAHFELLPGGGVKGTVHANSSMSGKTVVTDMTYAGERTGSCDYGATQHGH
jgi:hypothetical protein